MRAVVVSPTYNECLNIEPFVQSLRAAAGDIDLLVKLPSAPGNPALMAATLSGRLSRAFHGRRVDVVLDAPLNRYDLAEAPRPAPRASADAGLLRILH